MIKKPHLGIKQKISHPKSLKTVFQKVKKSVCCVTLSPPPPPIQLECHTLFEWPIMQLLLSLKVRKKIIFVLFCLQKHKCKTKNINVMPILPYFGIFLHRFLLYIACPMQYSHHKIIFQLKKQLKEIKRNCKRESCCNTFW